MHTYSTDNIAALATRSDLVAGADSNLAAQQPAAFDRVTAIRRGRWLLVHAAKRLVDERDSILQQTGTNLSASSGQLVQGVEIEVAGQLRHDTACEVRSHIGDRGRPSVQHLPVAGDAHG